MIVYAEGPEDRSAELTEVVSKMKIDQKQDAEVQLLYEARNRYPRAVADGLLARVRAGCKLFYGADDMLASAAFIIEDDELLTLALANPASDDSYGFAVRDFQFGAPMENLQTVYLDFDGNRGPGSFTEDLMVGDAVNRTLHIDNTGGSDLIFSGLVNAEGLPVPVYPGLRS